MKKLSAEDLEFFRKWMLDAADTSNKADARALGIAGHLVGFYLVKQRGGQKK